MHARTHTHTNTCARIHTHTQVNELTRGSVIVHTTVDLAARNPTSAFSSSFFGLGSKASQGVDLDLHTVLSTLENAIARGTDIA
jgi:hypothetical protein